MAQFVCGWVVGFVLIFLTTQFARVPTNILGSIILVAVSSLFEHQQAIYLWKVNKLDFACWITAFCGVVFYSVEVGLAISIALAGLISLYQVAFPNTLVLGRLSSAPTVYRLVI